MTREIFYTLSGQCRVIERPLAHPTCRFLAEIVVQGGVWAAISGQRIGQSFFDAMLIALANDRFDGCYGVTRGDIERVQGGG